jgi:uncharacterized protein YecT (DUF1311 family)
MKYLTIFFCLFFSISFALADDDADEPTYSALAVLPSLHIPAADLPTPAELKTLKDCNSFDLYYGFAYTADRNRISVEPDYVKARLCALSEMSGSPEELNDLDVLSMIYANGYGVKHNLALAEKLAQENNLYTKKFIDDGSTDDPFTHVDPNMIVKLTDNQVLNVCDIKDIDDTNTTTLDTCLPVIKKMASQQRQATLQKLSGNWTPAQQVALQQLNVKADIFFTLRSNTESIADQISCDYSAIQARPGCNTQLDLMADKAYGEMQDDLVATLVYLDSKGLSDFSEKEYKESDVKLNLVYQNIIKQNRKDIAILKTDSAINDSLLIPASFGNDDALVTLKRTQRAWLKYRDAWLAFGATRYPRVLAHSWETWLNQQRTAQLQKYLDLQLATYASINIWLNNY